MRQYKLCIKMIIIINIIINNNNIINNNKSKKQGESIFGSGERASVRG